MYVGDDVSPDFYGWVFPKCDHVAVGTGTVTILNQPAEKAAALNILMEHQAGKPVPVPEKAASLVSVFRLDVSEFAAKQHLPSSV